MQVEPPDEGGTYFFVGVSAWRASMHPCLNTISMRAQQHSFRALVTTCSGSYHTILGFYPSVVAGHGGGDFLCHRRSYADRRRCHPPYLALQCRPRPEAIQVRKLG